MNLLRQLAHDRSGATAIEYGLIVALLAIAIVGSLSAVADGNNGLWATVTAKSEAAFAQPTP
ncbi:Flp family type IVb pilin [Novosphingobium tardum]|uniref:Flp family type IVb pilin n=2 Tax=Novosphingobium tardum TaxID=1538021 RepID=A0ABV8RPR7_9SPHN